MLSALWAAAAVPVAAQTAPPLVQQPSVTVTATRSDLSLADQPVSASQVTREQILATPAQSLDDVLRTIVGINLPDYASYTQHPTANLVSMRGLGGYARVLVLRDGVPLNDPFFGYVQWNRVPLDAVERVDVVRGALASAWGNYAMGGVVNMVSRRPQASEAAFDAGYGQRETSRLSAAGTFAMSERFALDLDANQFRTAGYNSVPGELRAPLDIPTSFRARTGEATARGRLDGSLEGFVRAGYHEDHQLLGTPSSLNWQRNADYSAGLNKRFDGGAGLALTAFHTDEKFWTANVGTPEAAARGFAEYVQNLHVTPVTDTGASAVWSKRLGAGLPTLSLGADFRHIDGSDTAQIFDETGTQVRTDIGRGEQRFVGEFAQLEWVPLPQLQLVAGVRHETWKNYNGFDGNPGGQGAVPDVSASSTNPRLSVRYTLDDHWALRAAGYKAFRAPNLNDLYRGYSIPGGTFLPNPDLKPERLTGGEAGADFDYGALHGQLTAYSNTIRDLLTSRNLAQDELPPGFFFGTRNINAGRARTNGIELEAHWQFARAWNAVVNYAHNNPKILENPADPTTAGNIEGGIPRNAAALGLVYAPGPFTAATRVRYVQGYFTDNAGALPIDSYTVFDLSGSWRLTRRVELYAQIENLFNRQYIAQNSGNATPSLGTPFTAFAGVRIALR
jgi:outer membrane receptor protein involved in Fe transport